MRAHPVPVEVLFTPTPLASLRDGTADAAILCDGSDDFAGLTVTHLTEAPPLAFLPAGHRLAGRAALTMADVEADPAFARPAPDTAVDEILDRVALGDLVTVMAAHLGDRLGPGIATVPVTGRSGTRIVVARLP
ncbi:LysR substrate-binding domain-containing protein [Streptomyces sp. 4F14]|uniref:LysR substrate-binding domain-containing protein n=1 Tax=Streptomyces sp. 4F14 TaxID=3394380 RepID=UPI003A87E259